MPACNDSITPLFTRKDWGDRNNLSSRNNSMLAGFVTRKGNGRWGRADDAGLELPGHNIIAGKDNRDDPSAGQER